MNVSVQTDDIRLLREALRSRCGGVRFGSEFCEHLLPGLGALERAYQFAREADKGFTYVTPRLSNAGIKKLKEHLSLLNEKGEVSVVVNDFGALNVLTDYAKLHPHLGRHLFVVPARSPLAERRAQRDDASSEMGRWAHDLYSSTSLNYEVTIELYRSLGCQRADADWIPRVFPSLGSVVRNGFALSVHVHLVPVTFTRKCHMARFLGEKSPETCSRPCRRRAFVLRNEALEVLRLEPYYLHGNAVLRFVQPSPGDLAQLMRLGVAELVLTMNPLTQIDTTEKIDDLIASLGLRSLGADSVG